MRACHRGLIRKTGLNFHETCRYTQSWDKWVKHLFTTPSHFLVLHSQRAFLFPRILLCYWIKVDRSLTVQLLIVLQAKINSTGLEKLVDDLLLRCWSDWRWLTHRVPLSSSTMLPGVGVFGTGSTARVLVPLLKAEGFEVHALWGRSEEEACCLAKELSIPFHTSRSDDVLLHQDVDLVCIYIPPSMTRQIAVKALGKTP